MISKKTLKQLINDEDITIFFQPIYEVSKRNILGYEALTRLPEYCENVSPELLFKAANTFNLLSELEFLCRKLAIVRFSTLQLSGYLFLNVSPYTLAQADHPQGKTVEILNSVNILPSQVVIEVTEQFEAQDHALLKKSLEYYRNLGFKIAIDDLGTGHSGLMQWAELLPDIVKIDRYFISECHTNVVKRELLRTIFALGAATNVDIIAEGIEEPEEFALLEKLGMRFAQGYLLAKPSYNPSTKLPKFLHQKKVSSKSSKLSSQTLSMNLH